MGGAFSRGGFVRGGLFQTLAFPPKVDIKNGIIFSIKIMKRVFHKRNLLVSRDFLLNYHESRVPFALSSSQKEYYCVEVVL